MFWTLIEHVSQSHLRKFKLLVYLRWDHFLREISSIFRRGKNLVKLVILFWNRQIKSTLNKIFFFHRQIKSMPNWIHAKFEIFTIILFEIVNFCYPWELCATKMRYFSAAKSEMHSHVWSKKYQHKKTAAQAESKQKSSKVRHFFNVPINPRFRISKESQRSFYLFWFFIVLSM